MSKNPVIEIIREEFDGTDAWGSVMAWRFAIADFLTDRDPEAIPREWEFRQSMGGSDTDADEYQSLVDLFEADKCSIADVVHAGKVMHKLDRQLELSGNTY